MSPELRSFESETARMRAELAEERAKSHALAQLNAVQRGEIERLKKDLRLLRNQIKQLLGGRTKSHVIAEGQLSLFGDPPEALDVPEEAPAQPEHVDEAPDGETRDDKIKNGHKPKRRAHRLDSSLLPRDQVFHDLPEEQRICPETGVPLIAIGEKIFEEIDYTPAKLRVIEHHQIQYGPAPELAQERQISPITAPLPPRALEGCTASASLIAHLLVMKYRFHLPLYRQEEFFQQAGLWLPRQTLCDWVLKAAFELKPIVVALMLQIRAGPVLHLDDTPIQCQGGKGASMWQAYLWAFVNPEISDVVYRFTPGRGAADLAPLLEGVSAEYLVGDGYKGNAAAARDAQIQAAFAGCWAHIIRGFRDARCEARQMAMLFEGDIRALYALEAEATTLGLDAVGRLALRRQRARPILLRIFRRTRGWEDLFSKSGKMAKAIKYLLNSRRALKTFLLDGRVPLDNNVCEHAIRPVAVGRKNWLFAGSIRGGEAAAIVYSLVESCRRANIEPFDYLRDVLVRVATHPASQVDELIPSRWAQLRAAPPTS